MKYRPTTRTRKPSGKKSNGWEAVAHWYDQLVGVSGHDYHRNVILPCALRMLAAKPGESIIDLCCGQGVLVSPLKEARIGRYLGVDASKSLIQAARSRYGNESAVRFLVDDVCGTNPMWADASHDASVCLMAVHDVANAEGLFHSMASSLRTGGRAVVVLMHPCFRIPKRSHWGFDHEQKIQYRRLDKYSSAEDIAVTTHPSRPSEGNTLYRHRSLSDLINGMGKAGLAVVSSEEPTSHRRSQGGGPFSKAEHRAAGEFPLFLALRAIRIQEGSEQP